MNNDERHTGDRTPSQPRTADCRPTRSGCLRSAPPQGAPASALALSASDAHSRIKHFGSERPHIAGGSRDQSGGKSDHKLTTDDWPAGTATVRVLDPTLTKYSPAGRETGWLSSLEASCVPAESNTE